MWIAGQPTQEPEEKNAVVCIEWKSFAVETRS